MAVKAAGVDPAPQRSQLFLQQVEETDLLARASAAAKRAQEGASIPATQSPTAPLRTGMSRIHIKPNIKPMGGRVLFPRSTDLQHIPLMVTGVQKPIQDKFFDTVVRSGETFFFKFAEDLVKKNLKKELTWANFHPSLEALKTVFLSINTGDFLDQYINSIQKNLSKHDLEDRFKDFHGKIETLKAELAKIGITGPEAGKVMQFWSGRAAKQEASSAKDGCCDSDVPLFDFLFRCWGYIRNHDNMKKSKPDTLTNNLPRLFSAMFASHACGVVHVYVSTKIDGQEDSAIFADGAFWSGELPVLLNCPHVTSILFHEADGDKKDEEGNTVWKPPVDLKQTALSELGVKIARRGDKSAVPLTTLGEYATTWRRTLLDRDALPLPVQEEGAAADC